MFILLSRMDVVTRLSGNVGWFKASKKRKAVLKVEYRDHRLQMLPYANVRVLNLASHSETCAQGYRLAQEVCRDRTLPPENADVPLRRKSWKLQIRFQSKNFTGF